MFSDEESDILTVFYTNNCKGETNLFPLNRISTKCKKYYKIKKDYYKIKISQPIILLKTAKNDHLCELKCTKSDVFCGPFLIGMRSSGLNKVPMKFGR